MKKTKIHKLSHALVLFLISWILCCCIDERDKYEVSVGSQQKSVTFSVKVPGGGMPKTYALTGNDENEVRSVAILLFDGNGNYTYQPIYNNSITSDPSDNTKKTFTVKVPEGSYDMVILANANTSLSAALGSINPGDPKSFVLKKLLLTNSNKWETNTSSGSYKHIPMWGEITGIVVNSNMPSNIPVTLSRMIAKIDVILGTAAKASFNLNSVHFYNYNDRGQVCPDAANWNSVTSVVTAPSVPASAQKLGNPTASPVTAALLYDGTAITKAGSPARGVSCSNEIYAFEAEAGSSANHLTNTCLVIGGYYNGSATETFYRVDMARTTGTGTSAVTTYLPLLRNHQYNVNINQISGPGLATPEDAFKSRPVNIQANIIQWSDGRFTSFAVNDQYMVGVSKTEFVFSCEARTSSSTDNILSVITDYPSGWKIEKIVDANGSSAGASWLTCNPMQDFNPAGSDIRLLMSINNTGSSRTAFIHIKAERLVYIVKVTQQVTANIGISITDVNGNEVNILEFVSTKQDVAAGIQPASQQFNVSWSPAASDLLFNTNPLGSNIFTFASGTGLDAIPSSGSLAGSSGSKTYTVRPPVITTVNLNSDPFYGRSSTILYQVSDGGVSTVNKTLTLRQYVYNMIPVVESSYLMDGTNKSFAVRSNSPFTVVIKSNPSSVISNLSTSGIPNTSSTGTPVSFNIKDDLTNPTLYLKNVVVTIKSPTGLFPDTDVTLICSSGIIQPKSNSYMVSPNGTGILIPVSRANDSMLDTQLGTNDAFMAELVWTDNANKIASNSNIKMIKSTGSGAGSYVLVIPGSAEGNAVVAVKNSSNKILWSWHIWVTSYAASASSSSGTLMDRNLGAIGNTPGQVNTKGLLYQWGRKDAFPGSTSINNTTEPTLYTASGTTSIAKTVVPVENNFANSVANPATFYYGSPNGNYDWYSNNSIQNNTLWEPASKTVYDPCPNGWRVPNNEIWNNFTASNFTWDNTTLGRTNASFGGFYPAAGSRFFTNGLLSYTGTYGYYWSATFFSTTAYAFSFNNSTLSYSVRASRSQGISVRCVKE